jgi:hypothetical protein
MRVELNSLGVPAERQQHRAALVITFSSSTRDLLDADAQRRLHTNPLRILDTKNPAMQDMVNAAPQLLDFPGRGLAQAPGHGPAPAGRLWRALDGQSAAGARAGLLQPHGVRVHDR